MTEEADIDLPGPFVVLQGMRGDGMCNTIDSIPIVLNDLEEDFHHLHNEEHASDGVVVDYDSLASSSGEHVTAHQQTLPTIHQSPMTTMDPMLASTNMPPLALNPLTATTAAATASNTNTTTTSLRRSTLDHDSFIVVDDGEQRSENRAEERAIESWNISCRSREVRYRQEWLAAQEQSHQLLHGAFPQSTFHNDDWWQTHGRLAIFEDVPKRLPNGTIQAEIIGTLSPGRTVIGTQMLYLDADSLAPLVSPKEHVKGVPKQVQLLKLEAPHAGYVVFSVNGYCFLGPGTPSQYVSPETWLWRVTYSGGAYIREGLELNTRHIATLPFGTFLQVYRKTISTDGGLSRLWVRAILSHDEGATRVEGWLSEYLNPTSTTGERGPIVQPVPFPVPALYQVSLREGALIRSDVELSSKQIGHAPFGATLCIVGRAFSEHPQDKCIERLKLAGNGGWVSVRLNEMPPNDLLVFSFQAIDEGFDPDNPGVFHLNAQSGVDNEVSAEFEGADLSSIDESNESSTTSSISVIRGGVATDGPLRHGYSEGNCIACLSEPRNATIVHGETGHIACCLVCARILKAQGKDVSILSPLNVLTARLLYCDSHFCFRFVDFTVPRLPTANRFRDSTFLGLTLSSIQSIAIACKIQWL